MTLEEFKINAEAYYENNKHWARYGQALFCYLHQQRPDLANPLAGSDADPFYANETEDALKFHKFWTYISEYWDRESSEHLFERINNGC